MIFYAQTRLHTEAFTQRSLYTEELLHTKAFTHSKLLHTGAFTQRSLYTKELFTHGSLLEANFGLLAAPRPAIDFLFWDHWETAIFGKILAGSLLEAKISAFWRPLGRLLNFSSGIIGKRPFLAKSWPGAFWKHISAIWRSLGRLLNFFSGIIGKRPFLPKS